MFSEWGEWTEDGQCSATCGQGQQKFRRECISEEGCTTSCIPSDMYVTSTYENSVAATLIETKTEICNSGTCEVTQQTTFETVIDFTTEIFTTGFFPTTPESRFFSSLCVTIVSLE